jgi:serine O-acetyltransferase
MWCFHWVRTRLQIEIPRGAAIDGGLRIDHFGSIIVNSQVVAGRNLTLSHGVLLGQNDTGFPTLQDDIYLGVGAKVIGGITLGTGMVVGAAAVVTRSFPDYAVVAGIPAKLIRIRDSSLPREEEARVHQERKRAEASVASAGHGEQSALAASGNALAVVPDPMLDKDRPK